MPGVGAYAACMAGLRAVDGPRAIGRRLSGGRPVLGICVGMQVLFERGIEHGVETEGCDEWPGLVERLQAPIVPHMGWNTVEAPSGSRMFEGVEGERFYFVHSYGVRTWALETHGRTAAPLVTWTETGSISGAGDRFVAAVENGPLWATQFHPEKSGDAGAVLLRTGWRPCEPGMSKERQKRRAEREAAVAAAAGAAGGRGREAGPPRRPQGEADRLGAQAAGPPDRAAGREAAPSGGRRRSPSWSRSTCSSSRSPRTSTSPASPSSPACWGRRSCT